MIPTREQFKEFMAYVQHAQEKEDNISDIDAFYDYLVEEACQNNK